MIWNLNGRDNYERRGGEHGAAYPMTANILYLLLPFSIAWFGVLLRQAFEMEKECRIRRMWGVIAWSLIPFGISALVWVYQGEVSVVGRNILLGVLGAAIGASVMIWLGYIFAPVVAPSVPAATNPAPPPSRPSVEEKPAAQNQLQPKTNEEASPKQPYYTRSEIDVMLTSLGELQRFFSSKPAPSAAIQKLNVHRTGVTVFPEIADFPSISDGLVQYAQQMRDDAKELEGLLNHTDEFVRSAVTELNSPSLPFYDTLERAAKIIRHVGGGTSDRGIAGRAISVEQKQVIDAYTKYSNWVRSSQTKIAEKISDLRKR